MVVRGTTSIAFADEPLQMIHLGNRGFLEYFHRSFQGPEKRVALVPQPTLPSV